MCATIFTCIISQSNMHYQSQTPDFLQTQLSTYISPLLLPLSPFKRTPSCLSSNQLISNIPTCQSDLLIPFCLTSKSSHSCWYYASAPHPYISLFTTILFHPFPSTTYLLRNLTAPDFTIPSTPFPSTILSPCS